jgi:hypothetical protein
MISYPAGLGVHRPQERRPPALGQSPAVDQRPQDQRHRRAGMLAPDVSFSVIAIE